MGDADYLRKLLEEETDLESPWLPSVWLPTTVLLLFKIAVPVRGISVSVIYDRVKLTPLLGGGDVAVLQMLPSSLRKNQAPAQQSVRNVSRFLPRNGNSTQNQFKFFLRQLETTGKWIHKTNVT